MKKVRLLAILLLFCMLLPILNPKSAATESEEYVYSPCDAFPYSTISSGLSTFVYNDGLLLSDSRAFSPDLAKASIALSLAAYDYSTLESAMTDDKMGFSIVGGGYDLYNREYADVFNNDLATYTIGYKQMTYDDKTYGVYNIVVRGTYNSEWYSNFNLGTSGNHSGFYAGASLLSRELETLFVKNQLNNGEKKEDRIVWITGHSRGAAISNIVAGQLTDTQEFVDAEHIFCYTYACPAVSSNLTTEQTSYTNIYNFNHSGDLVPAIPPTLWGYTRYGQTQYLDMDHKENVISRLMQEKGAEYIAGDSADVYVNALLRYVPREQDMENTMNKLLFLLVGYFMGGEEETTLLELIGAAGLTITNQTVKDILLGNYTLTHSVEELDNLITERVDAVNFIDQHYDSATLMTPEEFALFLSTNAEMIAVIQRLSGVEITTAGDFVLAKSIIETGIGPEIVSVTETLRIITTIFTEPVLDSILQAHEAETYALWINSMFLGYRGFYSSSEITAIPEDTIQIIGPECFYACDKLTDVELKKGVHYIGYRAFSDCTSLTSINLPESLVSLDFGAFIACTNLTSISLPESLKNIGNSVFSYCTNLTSINLPENLEYLGSRVFYECSALSSDMVVPKAITQVPDYAFYMCNSLPSIVLHNDVTQIGKYAFYECTSLKTLKMPISATYTDMTFYGCLNIESITYTPGNGSNFRFSDFVYDYTKYYPTRQSNASLKELVFEDGITEIPDRLASYCSKITELNLPSTITSIGAYAFYECSSLKTLKMPMSALYGNAFDECGNIASITYTPGDGSVINHHESINAQYRNGLTELVLEEGITRIPKRFAEGCSLITEIDLPSTITYIDDEAFEGCTGLTAINLPESLEFIGSSAFRDCSSVKTLKIPISAAYSSFTFKGCSNIESITYTPGNGSTFHLDDGQDYGYPTQYSKDSLTELVIEERITKIPDNLAAWCTQITELVLPSTLSSIGDSAFSNCTGLTTINLPENLTYLGSYAFGCCSNLSIDLVVPEAITEISDYAFYRCDSLLSVALHDNVTHIGHAAFADCSAMKILKMPISSTYELSAFGNLNNLESITFTTGTGSVFQLDVGYTSSYPTQESSGSLKTLILEEGITEIPKGYASGCSLLTEVELPSTITSIGDSAFSECSSLTAINLPEDLEYLGSSAFASCSNLESFTFSSDAPQLGENFAYNVTATVTYPCTKNWPINILQNYGGTLTWQAIHGEEELVPEVLPTVDTPGYTSHIRCMDCGVALTERQEIPQLNASINLSMANEADLPAFVVSNSGHTSVALQLMVAYYNENGKLVSILVERGIVEPDDTITLLIDETVRDAVHAKAYVLRGDSFIPITTYLQHYLQK